MRYVVGVDEAGRGPLAGPVAVGTVCAHEDYDFLKAFPGLNDSKKISEKAREKVFELLEQSSEVSYHVELVSSEVIDEKGIVFAVRKGVSAGVLKLLPNYAQGKVWLDGLLKAPPGYEQETVVKGDTLIPAIMLASVAAKVVRDRHMTELAEENPLYGFEKHKGYGTKAHYEALRANGPCALHRLTYIHTLST